MTIQPDYYVYTRRLEDLEMMFRQHLEEQFNTPVSLMIGYDDNTYDRIYVVHSIAPDSPVAERYNIEEDTDFAVKLVKEVFGIRDEAYAGVAVSLMPNENGQLDAHINIYEFGMEGEG